MPSSFDSDVDRRMHAVGVIHTTEELLASVSLALMMFLPLAEIVIRPFFAGGISRSLGDVDGDLKSASNDCSRSFDWGHVNPCIAVLFL